MLLSIFVGDATVTLIRRMVKGEKWWEAHRCHFYQRAVRAGWSHQRVAVAVLLVGAVLAGLATLEMLRYPPRGLWIVTTLVILLTLAFIVKRKESSLDRAKG